MNYGQPSTADIFEAAREQGKNAAQIAIANGVRPAANMWPAVKVAGDIAEAETRVDLLGIPAGKDSLLVRFAENVSQSIQFPPSTAFLGALGCVSAAMAHKFDVELYGSPLHTGIYVVSGQPPSSGKSGVMNEFFKPVRTAFEEVNRQNAVERNKIKRRISKYKQQIKEGGAGISDAELDSLSMQIAKEEDKLDFFPEYAYELADATPESLSKRASDGGGYFAVVSEEAQSLNSLLGLSYGDGKAKANTDAVLKGWDGGRVTVARVGREQKPYDARGVINVMAQNEAIAAMLQAGQRGTGLSERFLMIQEEPIRGHRTHFDFDSQKLTWEPVDGALRAEYSNTIHALVFSEKKLLKLSKMALKMLAIEKQRIEPMLAPGGEYSNALLAGVMGKMDKQVVKIAGLLHGLKEWAPGGSKSTLISDETLAWAIEIFSLTAQTYINSAQAEGYAGVDAEREKVLEKIVEMATKSPARPVSYAKLYQAVRNLAIFKGEVKFAKKLKDSILPDLEKDAYIVFHDKQIYVNPGLL